MWWPTFRKEAQPCFWDCGTPPASVSADMMIVCWLGGWCLDKMAVSLRIVVGETDKIGQELNGARVVGRWSSGYWSLGAMCTL